MGPRKDRLSRPRIASPCRQSLDAIPKGDADRHCVQCGRQVFELRSPQPLRSWTPQRTSPVGAALAALAALIIAFLGHGHATAQPAPRAPTAISAAGVGWETLPVGGISVEADPLRWVFEESALVALGTVVSSRKVDAQAFGSVVTELRLNLVLKGRESRRNVRVVHSGDSEDAGGTRLATGSRILAFLKPGEGATGAPSERAYESTDSTFGLKSLPDAERSAYRERIEALARIPRDSAPHPADLMEWLVATAEEPLTRKAAAGEIQEALSSLVELARRRGTSEERAASDLRTIVAQRFATGQRLRTEPSPALLAAFLSAEQRERLSRALLTSPTLDIADLTLYEIVKPWDREASLSWFVRQLLEVDPPTDAGFPIMNALAQEVGGESLRALVKTAKEQLIEISVDRTSYGSAAALRLGEIRAASVEKKLLRDFRLALSLAD